MSHTKIVSPSGWDFGEKIAAPVKVSSRGLIGADRSLFIKRAGDSANVFLPYLDSIKVADDEEPVHMIALGAKNRWGQNRNGDGFDEPTCRQQHHTFMKFARAYRSHENKDPAKSYGYVKQSAYNDAMHRVELLVMYNRTKEAAERNGGLVADREIEKLASGADLADSMACRVPFDVCTSCGHEASTRKEYCTADMCKAGGCKDNLTRLVKIGNDVLHVGVLNPGAIFFDISSVFRPADYTAYGHRADWLNKAASDHGFFGIDGAKIAEDLGITAPLEVILYAHGNSDPQLASWIKLAYALDAMERQPEFALHEVTKLAFHPERRAALDLVALQADTPVKLAAVLGLMADEKQRFPGTKV